MGRSHGVELMHHRLALTTVCLLLVTWTALSGRVAADESSARALWDGMLKAMRDAESISLVSSYRHEVEDGTKTACTYKLWLKKPNYFRMETFALSGEAAGVLIGDGESLWIHWPGGRPRWDNVRETEEDEATRHTSYITRPAPQGKHSIWHEAVFLGGGMVFPILEASTFHGYVDTLEKEVDDVRHLGTEVIDGQVCDMIEISMLDGQRRQTYSLSRKDHLPRKLGELVRVEKDHVVHERWSLVAVNESIPDTRFQWQPPQDWKPWSLPDPAEEYLKPGTKAPDFELKSVDGKRIRLSDFEGKAIWLCFWRLGCPPCRVETPFLQELYERHKKNGFVVLAVNVSDDQELTQSYLEEQGVSFPNILDTSDEGERVCYELYGVGGVPMNYVIDRNGLIVDGGFGHTEERAKQALRQLGLDSP